MSKLSLLSSAAFLSIACGPVALAGDHFTFLNDSRQCTAFFAGNASGSAWNYPQAPFTLFEGGADVSADNGIERWAADCFQVSSLTSDFMVFDSTAAATVFADPTSNPLQARAQPKFDVYFSVAAPTQYALVGRISEFGHPDSIAQVTLTRSVSGSPIIESIMSTTDSDQVFSWHGVLEPGTYRLFAEGSARCRTVAPLLFAGGVASCSFSFSAFVPITCRSDWNGDGVVDTADFFLFLQDFLASGADFNGDGVSDSVDFFAFIQEFDLGC